MHNINVFMNLLNRWHSGIHTFVCFAAMASFRYVCENVSYIDKRIISKSHSSYSIMSYYHDDTYSHAAAQWLGK